MPTSGRVAGGRAGWGGMAAGAAPAAARCMGISFRQTVERQAGGGLGLAKRHMIRSSPPYGRGP
ncbi:hypothetical protein BPNSA17_38760 [Bordetella petrii]